MRVHMHAPVHQHFGQRQKTGLIGYWAAARICSCLRFLLIDIRIFSARVSAVKLPLTTITSNTCV